MRRILKRKEKAMDIMRRVTQLEEDFDELAKLTSQLASKNCEAVENLLMTVKNLREAVTLLNAQIERLRRKEPWCMN